MADPHDRIKISPLPLRVGNEWHVRAIWPSGHPMHARALVMLLGIPIALGSWWGLLIIVAMMPALIWRLIDEERFLARNLPGYVEYQRKVQYRLIPLVW